MEEEDYGLSDSEDGYGKEEKVLLDEVREKGNKTVGGSKNAVFAFGSEDDDDEEAEGDEDVSDIDMGSDIEERQDYLPDDRAWGQKRKNFYSTDFVDKDYSGAYNAEEAEAAELEEEEARNIQKRLMEQLSDADFSLADFAETDVASSETKAEVVETDLSKLSKRQKLDLFRKESPEFANLVEDFEAKLTEASERIIPVLNLIKEGKLPKSPAGDFLQTKYRIILNYCTNIAFYVLLKTKKISVKDHPVLKTLFRYRQLLSQLQPVDEETIAPQVDKILEGLAKGNEPAVADKKKSESKTKKKKILKILKKKKPVRDVARKEQIATAEPLDEDEEKSDSDGEGAGVAAGAEQHEKRAITYEMAKNKGLTPKRSKEQRNPRVKHRNKFRKANIRRRGQVRTPRSEIPVYGGEPTGIKIGLKKGRKLM